LLKRASDIWKELLSEAPLSRQLLGRRAPGVPEDHLAFLAVGPDGSNHLLVLVPDDRVDLSRKSSRVLSVATSRYSVAGRPEADYLDVYCTDTRYNGQFALVVEDLLAALRSATQPSPVVVESVLARWRAFWRGSTGRLTDDEVLGLVGELWFMHRWLSRWDSCVLSRWNAVPNSRHDFRWPEAAVEVKTTATGRFPAVHQVSSLDQLTDPDRGSLYLFSLSLRPDDGADLSLGSLVSRMADGLVDDAISLEAFWDKLLARGLDRASLGAYSDTYRVVGQGLYVVRTGFPRLTRDDIPARVRAGICDVSYSFSLLGSGTLLVALTPEEERARRLVGALLCS
jgi:hypothetical protein